MNGPAIRLVAAALVALSCLASGAAAQEEPAAPAPAAPAGPPSVEQAADGVIAAVRAKDDAALKALAAKDEPDPWLVADELISRELPDAADAFARAVPRPAVAALPAYVARCRMSPRAADLRSSDREAAKLLAEGHPQEALARLDVAQAHAAAPAVSVVKRLRVRGQALADAGRIAESVAALRAAAEAAESAGWLAEAVECRRDAVDAAEVGKDLPAMQEEWTRVAELRERLGDLPGLAKALLNVGAIASMRGSYVEAAHQFERSSEAFARAGDVPSLRPALGRLLDNQGLVASWLGHYSEAFAFFGRSCDVLRATGDRARLAHALADLGELHCNMGSWAQAVACETEALRVAEEVRDEKSSALASYGLGFALRELRRLGEAEQALTRARDLFLKTGDAETARVAEVELAKTLRYAGRAAEAEPLLAGALAGLAQTTDRRRLIRARLELGAQRLAAGRSEEALAAFHAAAEGTSSMSLTSIAIDAARGAAAAQARLGRPREAADAAWRALVAARSLSMGLAATQLTGVRSDSPREFDEVAIGADAACALGDAGLLCAFLEQGRAGAIIDSLGAGEAAKLRDATVRPELRAEEARLRDEQAAARRRLDVAVAAGDLAAIRAGRTEVDAAGSAVVAVVERVHVESRLGASFLYPEPATLATIQATLGPRDALVVFAATPEQSLALVVTPDGARIARLGPPDAVAAACAALDASAPGRATVAAAEALRARVIAPLAIGDGVQRLLVVPDGPLAAAAFSLLLPGLEIACLPSATTYVLLQPQRDLRGREVLAFGDPDLGGAVAPLPGAREEARAVGDRVLAGADASEAALRAALVATAPGGTSPRRRAIHFACHGIVDAERPWNSALVLAPGGGHDGRLTALDVVGLDLQADLAVLSACDTARGRVVRGDGVVGLPRAFLAAGTPRVLVSLWKVDDAATSALMRRFYELWKDGSVSAARALRDAQSSIRSQERWKDPCYWAGWELWGLPD